MQQRSDYRHSERDIPVLAPRAVDLFGPQHLQVAAEARPRVSRVQHRVDEPPLRRHLPTQKTLAGELQGDYTREGKKGAYHGVGESVGVLGGAAVRVLAAEDDLHRALTVVPEGVRYQY